MLLMRMSGWRLSCDRCGRLIRGDLQMLTAEACRKLQASRKFCAACVEARRAGVPRSEMIRRRARRR
jgi:hypothetical protein